MRSRACSDLLALTLAFSGHTVVIDGPPEGHCGDVGRRQLVEASSCCSELHVKAIENPQFLNQNVSEVSGLQREGRPVYSNVSVDAPTGVAATHLSYSAGSWRITQTGGGATISDISTPSSDECPSELPMEDWFYAAGNRSFPLPLNISVVCVTGPLPRDDPPSLPPALPGRKARPPSAAVPPPPGLQPCPEGSLRMAATGDDPHTGDEERRYPLGDCTCAPGWVQDPWVTRRGGDAPRCVNCEIAYPGALCSGFGVTLRGLQTRRGWWRPTASSLNFSRCPFDSCIGGLAPDPGAGVVDGFDVYDPRASSTCANGTSGAWCEQCEKAGDYFDEELQNCESCAESLPLGLTLVIAVAVLAIGMCCGARRLRRRGRPQLRRVSFSVRSKLKIIFSFYSIIVQIGVVYDVHYPPSFRRLLAVFDAFQLKLLEWVPGLHSKCFGFPDLTGELLVLAIVPLLITLFGLLTSVAAYRRNATTIAALPSGEGPLTPDTRTPDTPTPDTPTPDTLSRASRPPPTKAALRGAAMSSLPLTLVVTFIVSPSIASRGFRVLSACTCFTLLDDVVLPPSPPPSPFAPPFPPTAPPPPPPPSPPHVPPAAPPLPSGPPRPSLPSPPPPLPLAPPRRTQLPPPPPSRSPPLPTPAVTPPPSMAPRRAPIPPTAAPSLLPRAPPPLAASPPPFAPDAGSPPPPSALVCFLPDDLTVRCERPCGDSLCVGGELRSVAILAAIIYGGIVPLMYAGLLFACRTTIRERRSTRLSRALQLLYAEYRTDCFAWEMLLVALKLLLTGVLALYHRGSLEQLYAALLAALTFMVLQLWVAPYRDESDAALGAVSATALVLYIITTSNLQAGAKGATFAASQLPTFVLILSAAALALLIAFLLQFWQRCRTALRLPIAHWRSDQAIAVPSPKPSGQFHVFVSHQWGSGQDQARSIKDGLLSLAPGLSCFLDVDDLTSISELERLVDASELIVVFLSGSMRHGAERSDYFHSANCLRELRHAVMRRKPIVLVYETDRQHGGCSLETHRRDCPPDLKHLLAAGEPEHGKIGSAEPAVALVAWLRVREFRQQSLLQILAAVMRAERPTDSLYIPQSVLEQPSHAPPLRSAGLPPLQQRRYHVYASPSNAGAAAVAALLRDECQPVAAAEALQVCSDPTQRTQCSAFVLLLDETLFDEAADVLEDELTDALDESMPIVLMHEQRSLPHHHPIDFDRILERTPPRLRRAGLYSQTATPLHDHPKHLAIGLRLALRQLDHGHAADNDTGTANRLAQTAAQLALRLALRLAQLAMTAAAFAWAWLAAHSERCCRRCRKSTLDDRPQRVLLDGACGASSKL